MMRGRVIEGDKEVRGGQAGTEQELGTGQKGRLGRCFLLNKLINKERNK